MDGEDRAHADIGVDVRRAVERVEGDGVLGDGASVGDRHGVDEFLRRHDAEVAQLAERGHEDLVGEVVQLADLFALHVRLACQAQDIDQSRLPHLARDDLRGQSDLVQDARKDSGRPGVLALHVVDVLGESHPDLGSRHGATSLGRGLCDAHQGRGRACDVM